MKNRKTKKWQKVLLILVAVLLLIAITAASVFWFYPYPRYIAWNKTPIESEKYFDFPDQILFYYKGRTKILRSEESISEAYDAFWNLLGGKITVRKRNINFATKSGGDETIENEMIQDLRNLSESEICIEFRYRQRRSFYTERQDQSMVYDATLVVISTPPQKLAQRDYLLSCCSLNGVYTFSDVGMYLKIDGTLGDFVNYVQSLYG